MPTPASVSALLQRVAAGMANDEKMPNRFGPIRNKGQSESERPQFLAVTFCNRVAPRIPFVEMRELNPQNRGLQADRDGYCSLELH